MWRCPEATSPATVLLPVLLFSVHPALRGLALPAQVTAPEDQALIMSALSMAPSAANVTDLLRFMTTDAVPVEVCAHAPASAVPPARVLWGSPLLSPASAGMGRGCTSWCRQPRKRLQQQHMAQQQQ